MKLRILVQLLVGSRVEDEALKDRMLILEQLFLLIIIIQTRLLQSTY